jgi:hypothetical protein
MGKMKQLVGPEDIYRHSGVKLEFGRMSIFVTIGVKLWSGSQRPDRACIT